MDFLNKCNLLDKITIAYRTIKILHCCHDGLYNNNELHAAIIERMTQAADSLARGQSDDAVRRRLTAICADVNDKCRHAMPSRATVHQQIQMFEKEEFDILTSLSLDLSLDRLVG